MTLCSTDAPVWLVQSPAGTSFVEASLSQDDGKGNREEGSLQPCLSPDRTYGTLPLPDRLRTCW